MAVCKICKELFTQYNTIQNKCVPCAIKIGKNKPVKPAYKRVTSELKREAKEKLESYPKRLQKAKKVFQSWIRLRDTTQPCISCVTTLTKKWDGGHYLKSELYSGVIFDERNVNKQCVSCNKHKDGNVAAYRQHLVKKIGTKAVEELEQLANETRFKKWSSDELEEIKRKYK
jgi:hypothetical protein